MYMLQIADSLDFDTIIHPILIRKWIKALLFIWAIHSLSRCLSM